MMVKNVFHKLNKLLVLRSENDIELHVKEVEKTGTRIKNENSGYNLAKFGHFKKENCAEFKRVKYRDLEYMVYRMELTYDENVDILDVNCVAISTTGFTLPCGIYEVSELKLMLKN